MGVNGEQDVVAGDCGDIAMSPAELRCVMEWLGLSTGSLAQVLGVAERTVRHWLAGQYRIPPGAAADLEDVERYTAVAVGELVDALRDAADVGVVVYAASEDMWAARPAMRPYPARWWRHVAMRAAQEVPGLDFAYPSADG